MTKRKGFFPGYLILIAGSIMTYWASGTHAYSFGNYVKIFNEHFGWSRAQISLGYSFSRLEGGLEGPFAGLAADRFGPRILTLSGFIMLGMGFMAMYYMNSLWAFLVIWVITGTGYNLGTRIPLGTAIANWFVKRRGIMSAFVRMGMSFSGPTIVPLTMWLLLQYGWRDTFFYLGVATLLIGVPITWFFIKPRRPEYYGWLPDGKRIDNEIAADTEATVQAGVEYAAAGEEVEFTARQAIRGRTFWAFTISRALRGMVFPALAVHTVPFLLDMGIDPIVAAAAMGTTVLMRLPTNFLFGWLGDRVSRGQLRYWSILGHAIEALGLFIFIRATSMAWVWAYVIVYGLGLGAGLAIDLPMRGRYWGRKAFGTISGIMSPFGMLAGVIAPVYAGWVYDTTGSYTSAFTMILILSVISLVVMLFATPPKLPEKVTRITDIV
ncbi:MFS transporter [Chloroflexota bacterium]